MKNLQVISAGILLAQITGTAADNKGFQTQPSVSHNWGNWSPWYSVPSTIRDVVPKGCRISMAQVVSRHGARYPAEKRTQAYKALVERVQKAQKGKPLTGAYAFLNAYKYALGADDITEFGHQQMRESGTMFGQRYASLAASSTKQPHVRSSGQQRVVDSCNDFMTGYKSALSSGANIPVLVIPEGKGHNNTLNNWNCDLFNEAPINRVGANAREKFTATFAPTITARLNKDLGLTGGDSLSDRDALNLMDICAFETVAMPNINDPSKARLHPLCQLFSEQEWKDYEYLQTVYNYYSYSQGNPLGPTLGVGFANELIARLTRQPVNDHTSYDHDVPFPTDRDIYIDLTHDTDMLNMYAALGLFEGINVDQGTRVEADNLKGLSLSRLVPFSSRFYVEKMKCEDKYEWVRVIVNDHVVELENCGGDPEGLGRCRLDKWVESLSFARRGGKWDECFKKQ